jgi:hypothetical protein
VFWKGPNKYGSGERLGVRGDDGGTYWVADSDVEPTTSESPKLEAGSSFEKGDRVGFRNQGRDGTGSVFWLGQSRNGPGQRLGIRDDDGDEAVWLDARFVKSVDPEQDPPRSASTQATEHDDPQALAYEDDEGGASWTPQLGMDDRPQPPPLDDSQSDAWASELEESDDSGE